MSKSTKRFYIDTQGNDDNAYLEAMRKASDIALSDEEIKRVILLINTKSNTGWFERIFDDKGVKRLFTGTRINGLVPIYKFETKITFKDYTNEKIIVITCGWDSDEVATIDNFHSVKYLIAIPWSKNALSVWAKTWVPTELRGKSDVKYAELSCIVKAALERLSRSVNFLDGLTHPTDAELAKTYLLALYKFEDTLNSASVKAFLKSTCGWDSDTANIIAGYIDILNSGKSLRGARKEEIDFFYNQWREACTE